MDYKTQSILTGFGDAEEAEGEESDNKIKIPQTADDWLEKMGYTIWPVQVEEEKSLNLTPEDVGTGSLEDIMKALAAHAPLDLTVMDDVLKQIEELECKVNEYASKLLKIQVTEQPIAGEIQEPDREPRVDTPPLVRRYRNEEESILGAAKRSREQDSMSLNPKSVESTCYFGFMPNELTPLPGQLESQQLLNKITKAQNFQNPFKVVWKKTILSEASVAVFQDAFWWFYCHHFQKSQPTDAIFSRISDSFIALFFNIPPGYKDRFFQHYPNCLAQAVYAAFCEAFPNSYKLFDDDFKNCLLDTVCEWVWGIRPPPQSWRSWQTDLLEPHGIQKSEKSPKSVFQMNLTFDMDTLLEEECDQQSPSEKSKPGGSPSRLFQFSEDDLGESHPAGPGPNFAKVHFNILGQSPLVSHFLHFKGLKKINPDTVKKIVGRTEVAKLPVPKPTYRDLINECKKNSRILSQQYRLILEMSAEESQKIQKQKKEVLAKINQMQNDLTRRHSDFKALSERIYDVVFHSDY